MAITARLIGKLGGAPEVVSQQVNTSSAQRTITLPTGWGSAWCIFQGVTTDLVTSVTVFGRTTSTGASGLTTGTAIGGAIMLTSGSTTIGYDLSGTLTQIRMT